MFGPARPLRCSQNLSVRNPKTPHVCKAEFGVADCLGRGRRLAEAQRKIGGRGRKLWVVSLTFFAQRPTATLTATTSEPHKPRETFGNIPKVQQNKFRPETLIVINCEYSAFGSKRDFLPQTRMTRSSTDHLYDIVVMGAGYAGLAAPRDLATTGGLSLATSNDTARMSANRILGTPENTVWNGKMIFDASRASENVKDYYAEEVPKELQTYAPKNHSTTER